MDSKILAENVSRLRHARKLTQNQLRNLTNKSSIAMIESGKISSPRYQTIEAIARALGVTVAELYTDPNQRKRKRS